LKGRRRLPWWLSVLAALAVGCSSANGQGAVHAPVFSHPPATPTVVEKQESVPQQSAHPQSGAATQPAESANIYAATGTAMLSPKVAGDPYRLYVPDSGGRSVEVIDPAAGKVVATYVTGLDPQHIVPAWDLATLYATNDLANTITPIDPKTGAPRGPALPVDDPYNMYFTPDGSAAIVVAEARQNLDFRDPHTFALRKRLHLDCAGVDHLDFASDGSYLIASCEFAGKLVKVDLKTDTAVGYLALPKSSPQDVKIDPTGTTFYVADKFLGGVHLIDAAAFRQVGFVRTGKDSHGLYPSRDGKSVYVSNRGAATITVIDFASRTVVATWRVPGGSPDMGGVSPDGKTLWLTGRYNHQVYGLDTATGRVIARIQVGSQPHGMAVWPQPGRYSLGHTGNMR
jgi:YVTN family beta-propeller protein